MFARIAPIIEPSHHQGTWNEAAEPECSPVSSTRRARLDHGPLRWLIALSDHSARGPEHHHAAGKRNGDSGSNRQLLRHRRGDAASQLSVAEERREHQRSDIFELHDSGNEDV